MKILYKFLLMTIAYMVVFNLSGQSAPMGTTFTNSTADGCNVNNGCVSKSIVVSGVGLLSSTKVLNSIKINMGSSTCQANLSTYDFTLSGPGGTPVLNFITDITTSTTSGWINTTFVDNSALERIRTYTTSTQTNYNPWSIGYYAPDVIGSFASTFNGINADGTWTLTICESSASSMISFNSASITFGTPVPTFNASSININDCAQAQCVDNNALIVATNNGYTGGDALYPGGTVSGCSWNANNDNSAWFKFTPTGTTAKLTISGIQTSAATQNDTQPIVLENTGGSGCPSSITSWVVPTGGCPDDATINNTAYLTANGGEISTAANVYTNGITANAEFNLSGLTPNKTYYLMVDGNGGASSSFMVELKTPNAGAGAGGAISCNLPLPIELLSFNGENDGRENMLYWATETEKNNAYFTIERSVDFKDWEVVTTTKGAGTSISGNMYEIVDNNYLNELNYYRLSQTDFDGTKAIFENYIITIDNRFKFKDINKVYNVMGQEVDIKAKGVIIIVYNDGTVLKTIN